MTSAASSPARHSRRALFIPFILVGILLALWTGYWFWLSNEAKTRMVAQLDRLEASGWVVDYSRIGTSGWPMHTRLTLHDAQLVAPSGHGVKSPALAAEANSYKPLHWVLSAPDGLSLLRAEKGETLVTAQTIRLSLTGLRQTWPNVAFEIVKPQFAATEGSEPFPLADAELVQLYMRPHVIPGTAPSNDVDVMFRLVRAHGREGGPVQGFAQNDQLTIQLEAVVEKASALRQPATTEGLLAAWTNAGGRFTTIKGEMLAGETHALLTSPALFADDKGQLEGEVSFKARKPLAALVGLAGSHQGKPGERAAAASAAAATPQGGEGAAEQDVELSVLFRNGRTYLGPFGLAPAPKLF